MSNEFVAKGSPVTPGAEAAGRQSHAQTKQWTDASRSHIRPNCDSHSPFTKAIFSPRPTLFFTLLTNLRDRRTRGWSTNKSTPEEHVSLLPTDQYTHLHPLAAKTKHQKGRKLQRKDTTWGTDRLREYLHSTPQTDSEAWLWQQRGEKNSEQKKMKRGKETRETHIYWGRKDSEHWISHLVVDTDFGPDDVGGAGHQAERQVFGRTRSWEAAFKTARPGFCFMQKWK